MYSIATIDAATTSTIRDAFNISDDTNVEPFNVDFIKEYVDFDKFVLDHPLKFVEGMIVAFNAEEKSLKVLRVNTFLFMGI